MSERLDRALDNCLFALKNGATVEQCLKYYAELRDELAPLLAEAGRLAAEVAPGLPAERRLRARGLVMAAIADEG